MAEYIPLLPTEELAPVIDKRGIAAKKFIESEESVNRTREGKTQVNSMLTYNPRRFRDTADNLFDDEELTPSQSLFDYRQGK